MSKIKLRTNRNRKVKFSSHPVCSLVPFITCTIVFLLVAKTSCPCSKVTDWRQRRFAPWTHFFLVPGSPKSFWQTRSQCDVMTFIVDVNNVKFAMKWLFPNMGKKLQCYIYFLFALSFFLSHRSHSLMPITNFDIFAQSRATRMGFKGIGVNACAASNTSVRAPSFLVGCLADSVGGVASGWPHFWFIGPEWGNYEAPSVTAQKFENLGCHWTDEWRAGRGSACPPPSYVTVQSDEKPCLLLCLHRPKESGGNPFFTQAARGRNRVSWRGEAPMAMAYQILFNFI